MISCFSPPTRLVCAVVYYLSWHLNRLHVQLFIRAVLWGLRLSVMCQLIAVQVLKTMATVMYRVPTEIFRCTCRLDRILLGKSPIFSCQRYMACTQCSINSQHDVRTGRKKRPRRPCIKWLGAERHRCNTQPTTPVAVDLDLLLCFVFQQ